MVTVGQRVSEALYFGERHGRRHSGTVVYIHPRGLFYVVEFRFDYGSFREAFYFPGRGGNE